jgi:hypothetical protein
MSKSEILAKLRNLHEELNAINDNCKMSEQVDEETIDALGQLITDAVDMLDHPQMAEVPKGDDQHLFDHGLLKDRIEQFETDHPHVTRFLSQFTDLLAMMGI